LNATTSKLNDPPQGAATEMIRRTVDILGSALLLLILAPIMLLLGLLVKLSSPGPVLFRQTRIGRHRVPFTLLKFRSMRPSQGGPEVTAGGDQRITGIGRIMRKYKLDELPQFLNVLRGEMALVGPRPEVPRYVEHYSPVQLEVLSVRPGVTGLTQLEYRNEEALLEGRDDVEDYYINEIMPAKLAIDLKYLQSRTLGGDMLLLLRTVWAVVAR